MKNIKGVLIIMIALIVTSCYGNLETIKDPKSVTTIEIQELPKDTVVISVNNSNLYIFDEQGLIKHKVQLVNSDTIPMHASVFILIIGLILFILIALVLNLVL